MAFTLQKKIFSANSIFLGLLTFCILLTEISAGKYVIYSLPEVASSLLPISIFGGIAVGNLLGLTGFFQKKSRQTLFLFTVCLTIISFISLSFASEFALLYSALPFVGYGIILSLTVADIDISSLVLGMGVGGIVLYILLGIFFDSFAPFLALLTCISPLLFVLFKPHKKIFWIFYGILLIAIVIIQQLNGFEPHLSVEKYVDGLKEAKAVAPPLYTPLIRTDVLKMKDNRYAIITNGRRFAIVTSALSNSIQPKRFRPSYDFPYLYVKPKKVLVIGSAEGNNILAALANNVQSITAVDINPSVFKVMQGTLGSFSGNFYSNPKVKTVADEGRHFLETTNDKYDLITLQGVETGTHGNLFNVSLLESYLLTAEAQQTLWRHLTPNGSVWFEEYMVPLGDQGSLISSVSSSVEKVLPFEDFEKQHKIVRFMQNQDNPAGKNKLWREGLLISKDPLEDVVLPDEVEKVDTPKVSSFAQSQGTDNHPYFIQKGNLSKILLRSGLIFLGLLFLSGIFYWLKFGGSSRSNQRLAIFLIGIGFILLICGVTGPIALLLGHPQLVTPILFITTYAFGVFGGLLSLKASEKSSVYSLVGLAGYLLLSSTIFNAMKPFLMSSESFGLRALSVVFVIAPIAVLAELPYVWLLKNCEGIDRAKAFTTENLGTFFGIPLALWLQFRFGFKETLWASSFCYALAFLVLNSKARGRQLPAWLIASSLSFSGAIWLCQKDFAEEPHNIIKVSSTIDCKHQKPQDKIEVALSNAKKLKKNKQVSVVVGRGDGCYAENSLMQLFGIHRTQTTHHIYVRKSKGIVRSGQILLKNFDDLTENQREYVLNKFGKSAVQSEFNILDLNLINNGEDKPHQQEHPDAPFISLDQVGKIIESGPSSILTFPDVKIPKSVLGIETIILKNISAEEEVDPEVSGFDPQITSLPTSKVVIIIQQHKKDLRAFNVATQLALHGNQKIYILRLSKN